MKPSTTANPGPVPQSRDRAFCLPIIVPIPEALNHNGHRYRLLKREGSWCLWQLFVNGSRKLVSYEVSKVVLRPAETTPDGRHYPARETLPKTEEIERGAGWAPSDRAQAERLFAEACKQLN